MTLTRDKKTIGILLGISSLAGFAALFKFIMATHSEDGPIRVRGGSLSITNDFGWDRDTDDDTPEYTFSGGRRMLHVKAWKNVPGTGQLPDLDCRGRRVRVNLVRGTVTGAVVFRANGSARVIDKDGKLAINPTNVSELFELGSVQITEVVVKDRGTVVGRLSIDAGNGEKGYLELTPE